MDQSTKHGMFGKYYVVLMDGEWHVLFEPDHLKRHFLSVARFQDEDRASSYVEMENMAGEDFAVDYEDAHSIQDLSKAGSIKALQVIPPTKVIPDIERSMSDFEQEVLADLAALMKDYPYGLCAKDLQDWYGVNFSRGTTVIKTLDARGLAKKVHWPDEGDATNRLVPLGYARPPMRVTEIQKKVLDGLEKMATNGMISVSQTAIGKATGVNPANVEGILGTLEKMGFIDPVALKPGGVFPATYRLTDQYKNR